MTSTAIPSKMNQIAGAKIYQHLPPNTFAVGTLKSMVFFGTPNIIIHEKHLERKIQVWYIHLHFTHKLSQSKCTARRQTHSSPMLCGKVCLSDLSIVHPAYFITTDHSIIVHIHLSPFQGWWIERGRVPTVIH